ncbi:condensation domain-containing protein [Flavobacterium sp. N502536]|uniref:condensation domain-containing protein n=1 Tax=Flavobacterium sp. N502536 TaxID=2986837 RepID=UPI00222132AA|nr:condensation domain-containing protein [Flavobacterium sp. N502536]
MVKWFPDGNIEFLGRKDHQVKLRGYRIELDEIENCLLQLSAALKQVVVAVKQLKGVDVLAAYYTGGEGIAKIFSKANSVTPFMTLMAGINAFIIPLHQSEYHYSGNSDSRKGTSELENQLGLFLNTLAIKTQLTGTDRFSDLLDQQKKTLIDAYEHQNYAFSTLVNKLNLKRDASRSALFDVLVVLQNQAQLNTLQTKTPMVGVDVAPYEMKRTTSQFDLSFIFTEQEESCVVRFGIQHRYL